VQYACDDYIQVLKDNRMMPSMSRPGNPFDNASCESFMKTLEREEIYANDYRDLEHLVESLGEFIERYYNRCRLHSALGTARRKSLKKDQSNKMLSRTLQP
jgi:putative transposase